MHGRPGRRHHEQLDAAASGDHAAVGLPAVDRPGGGGLVGDVADLEGRGVLDLLRDAGGHLVRDGDRHVVRRRLVERPHIGGDEQQRDDAHREDRDGGARRRQPVGEHAPSLRPCQDVAGGACAVQ